MAFKSLCGRPVPVGSVEADDADVDGVNGLVGWVGVWIGVVVTGLVVAGVVLDGGVALEFDFAAGATVGWVQQISFTGQSNEPLANSPLSQLLLQAPDILLHC